MSRMPAPTDDRLYVGIDIAAATATVGWIRRGAADATTITVPQTTVGFTSLRNQLIKLEPTPANIVIVMEATGSYWVRMAMMLLEAGFHVSVINPVQARHFAKALLKRAKTDAIDALTLAHVAAVVQPPAWTPPPAVYHELQQRLAQRDAVIVMRQQVRNQLPRFRTLWLFRVCRRVWSSSLRALMKRLPVSTTSCGPCLLRTLRGDWPRCACKVFLELAS